MEASISSAVASSPFAQLGVEGIILKYVSCRRQTFVSTESNPPPLVQTRDI